MSMIILSKIAEHMKNTRSFNAFRNVAEIANNCYKQWKIIHSEGENQQHYVTERDVSQILYSKANPIRLEI